MGNPRDKWIQELLDRTDDTLKKMFGNKINGNLLLKLKTQIGEQLGPELPRYYSLRLDGGSMVTGQYETFDYDVSRMIAGVHQHYSVFLSREEIRANEKNSAYQKKLVDEVVEKIRLHREGSIYFRKQALLSGDDFLYFPVPYELFAMCMRGLLYIANNRECVMPHHYLLLCNGLSALTLMENNILHNAYPICRNMMESYYKMCVVQEQPELLPVYERFCDFEIDQSCCSQQYPKEFNEYYQKRKGTCSKVNYLHYGWLDQIDTYDITNGARYSMYGIFAYLKQKADDTERCDLIEMEQLYKMCHGYVHGNVSFVKYPLLQYFEVSIMLCHIVRAVFLEIYQSNSGQLSAEDRCLVDMLDRDFVLLRAQYGERSTERFEMYYAQIKR